MKTIATAQENAMISFRPIELSDRAQYLACLSQEQAEGRVHGCEFSFANLFLWGRQRIAWLDGQILLFSQFNRRSVYPYPVGADDKRAALDAVIADARARGIPCRITGLDEAAMETLKTLYPGQFRFHCDRSSFDYVYAIEDLAELKGKKYHGKRNHLARFGEAHPHCTVEPLREENEEQVRRMADEWYRARLQEDPEGDYYMEQVALDHALRYYRELDMDGLVLKEGDAVLAFTMGSHLTSDTFDVQFEKAVAGVQGAYPAINRAFACYLRDKYPTLRYLNREEDMGLEGLRRAKESYYPHHMIEKCWGCLLEDGYDY